MKQEKLKESTLKINPEAELKALLVILGYVRKIHNTDNVIWRAESDFNIIYKLNHIDQIDKPYRIVDRGIMNNARKSLEEIITFIKQEEKP